MTVERGFGVRRRSREMALQLLFQGEFLPTSLKPEIAQEFLARFIEDFSVEKDIAEYGAELFLGVAVNLSAIDALIQAHSAHWKVNRMGLVDRSVMRIAIYEMKFLAKTLTPSIVIDEAVEIAKLYGSTESSAFVNGILDQVSRSS